MLLPDEKTSYHNLVSLYIKQSYEYLIYKAQNFVDSNRTLGIRVNYILDEFSSLPTISDFPAMITAARSRNIRFNLFLQSKKQLFLKYDEECNTIMSNCENWIYLSSRELDFLKELSQLCGETNSGNRKPLLSVSDLQKLDKEKGQVLILSGRNKPLITFLPDIDFYDEGTPKIITGFIHSQKITRNSNFRKQIYETILKQRDKENKVISSNVSENSRVVGNARWEVLDKDILIKESSVVNSEESPSRQEYVEDKI